MKLETLLEAANKLPATPQILPQLLNLLGDENSSFDDIVQLVSVDLSLTAQVLKLSNSAYYGLASKTYDLEDAIQRIGMQEVYKLIAVICSKELMGDSYSLFELEKGELWKYSLGCAFVLEDMALAAGISGSTAYTLGLLHGIGKILINQKATEEYREVFAKAESEGISLHKAEREVLGFTNGELAGALLKKWNFNSDIFIPVEYQFKPTQAPTHKDLACMLHLSIWVASHIGLNAGKSAWAFEIDVQTIEYMEVTEEQLQGYLVSAFEKLETIEALVAAHMPDKEKVS